DLGKAPDFQPPLQSADGFQMEATDLGEFVEELQNLFRLHHLVVLGDYRQWSLSVATKERLATRKVAVRLLPIRASDPIHGFSGKDGVIQPRLPTPGINVGACVQAL